MPQNALIECLLKKEQLLISRFKIISEKNMFTINSGVSKLLKENVAILSLDLAPIIAQRQSLGVYRL